ncbi:MAG TPA: hypothetical protein PKW75_00130 [candidate division Zixibacteria bacterium]|nr:hypothetical protein [candidate division Zixibacteria bacterium]MDD4917668.1 hypothetical protein [candidate division Zixibacteria bacterium]MDM7974072.1 hypothetical protein [candidate division Zixibacteria bacterium]HOD65559.1 hypothetical protein [candidate division Zixibacteria bacterium]HOZ06669.1 hypothetical protein [candidate division Zixibacteria bacterium]
MKLKKGLLALGVVILAAATGSAQEPARSGAVDSRMVVIPMRSVAEVTADIDNATMVKEMAAAQKAQAEGRLKEIELTIEQKQTALKDVDRRKGEAKKGQRQSEVIALDIEKKVEQQAIDLLKRLKDLRKAEIEQAQVEGELAERRIGVLQLEAELQRKRIEYDSLSTAGASPLSQTAAQQVLGEIEVKLLKLQQEQAGVTQKLASRQKDIVARRIKLHDAQVKLGMPRA